MEFKQIRHLFFAGRTAALLFVCLLITLMPTAQATAQSALTYSRTATADSQIKREYDILLHHALLEEQKANLDASFDLLQRCLELRPDAAEAHYFIGQLYSVMNQKEQALASFQRACQLEPDNTTFLEMLAQAYLHEADYTAAATTLERLYDADKGRQDLLETLYQIYWKEKDLDKAINTLERIEAADGPTEHTSLSKCRIYIERNDTAHAISEMKSLAEHYPNDPTYRTLYANTLLVADHFDQAYDELQKILAEDPENVRAQQVLRNYYIRQGDEEAADSVNHAMLLNPKATVEDKIEQMRQIIMENEQQGGDSSFVMALFQELLSQPDPSPAMAELKAAYMELKEMPRDSVRQALQYVLQLAPTQASARLRLVQQAWEEENDEAVITLCQGARQYNPEEMAFYYYQGMAYYRQNDTDHALEAFQNGISVIGENSRPDIVSDFYAVMGDLLHQKGRDKDAFAAYDSCLVWKPDNIGCLNNYAYYLSLKNDRLDDAERMSYITVKAEPDNATYLDTYAWILFMQKRYREAKVYIDQAISNLVEPEAVILEHGGDIHALCGETDSAVELWQKALESDPSNKVLKKKTKRKKYIKR